jgi:hypothetical protein
MTRARDVSRLVTTPPNIYATDTETSSAGYLTNASASSTYQTKAFNQFPYRNLLINGAMQVAQRATTSVSSITTSGYYTVDRFYTQNDTLGTWTQSVENDAPTGSGFRKSTKLLCTTADASPAAADILLFQQIIEGQNLQQIAKGTSAAQQLTLSFWVKANVTGTYIVGFFDLDNTRVVSKSYTIDASATWEKKTITFPADTTGAFDNDNAASLYVQFGLGAGSNYTSGTLQQTWAANTAANRFVGQVNLASATNNYWQITGIQLEVGDTATPFEFKSFGEELRACQRYYQKSYNYSVVPGTADGANATFTSTSRNNTSIPSLNTGRFGVVMRGSPTMTWYSPSTGASGKIRDVQSGVDRTIVWNFDSGDNFGGWIITDNAPGDGSEVRGHWQAVAEL